MENKAPTSQAKKRFCWLIFIIGIAGFFKQSIAQDTLWIPCTFYDYHADGSNPNFEREETGHEPGMIQDTLGSNYKPLFLENRAENHRVEEWYVPSGGTGATYDLFTAKWSGLRNYNGRPDEWVGRDFNPNDSMANIVMYDSLGFLPADPDSFPPGTYYFIDTTFFPLTERGFGNEPQGWNENFSYTMEFHRMFQYRGGEFFRFWGDDDVWVFIDGKLVIDIGGIHVPVEQTISMDSLADEHGWEKGKFYRLDFFYAERHIGWAKCYITTNIITVLPDSLHITLAPNDTIYVGDTLLANAQVFTDSGRIEDPNGDFDWGYQDLYANNPPSTFTSDKDSATFIPIDAHTTVKIHATYTEVLSPSLTITLSDTVEVVVLPGPPDAIVIEASPNKPAQGNNALWNNNPLDQVTIALNQDINEQFYAILRDKEQNWIGPADPIDSWTSDDPSLVSAEAGTNPSQGQGRAKREDWSRTGTVNVTATRDTLGKTLKDDIRVVLEGDQFAVLTATYYDTDTRPDGLIDKVSVTVSDRLTINNTVLDALFPNMSLPGSRNFAFSRSDVVATSNGFTIAVKQPSSTVPNTAVDPAVDILSIKETQIPGIGAIATSDVKIKDSLGVVINKAVYRPGFDQSTRDTLVITFSENTQRVIESEPFGFKDNSITYSMTLSFYDNNDKVMRFLVQNISGKPIPENNDSIWIEDKGNVTDEANITQDRDTKPVPLEVLLFPVEIASIVYKETDARPDGYIDLMRVTLNRKMDLTSTIFSQLASQLKLPSERKFNDISSSNFTDTDAGFEIRVSQKKNEVQASTSVSASDKLEVSDDVIVSSSYILRKGSQSIIDSLAPVVLKGTFCPKSDSENKKMKDTLIVDFSEEVKVPSEKDPFKFYDCLNPSQSYDMHLTPMSSSSGASVTFKVDTVIVKKEYPQNGDSLWIVGGKNVQDILSVKQDKNTVLAPLVVKDYPFNITLTVLNPVKLSKLRLNNDLITLYNLNDEKKEEGVLIKIKISGHIAYPEQLSATLDVFDAVGNYVSQDIEGHYVPAKTSLAVVWDARNKNGRLVGPAPYAGIVTVKYGSITIQKKIVMAIQK